MYSSNNVDAHEVSHPTQLYIPSNAASSCLRDTQNPPANGQRSITNNSVGFTVTYSCDAGFKLRGPSTVTCLTNGTWSSSEKVQCIGKSMCVYSFTITIPQNYEHVKMTTIIIPSFDVTNEYI